MPVWISKFLSVKLTTLVLCLWFIERVECEPLVKVAAITIVSLVFIIAKTVQNIMLKDNEHAP